MRRKTTIFLASIILSLTACSPSFNVSREEFYFTLSWGVNLEKDASYDSRTKILIKTKNVMERSPEEYITTYEFPKMDEIYEKAKSLNPYSYPDTYDPYSDISERTTPAMNYLLETNNKTILSEDCLYTNSIRDGLSKKQKKYLQFIFDIINIICDSEEWKSLPEYEFFYM